MKEAGTVISLFLVITFYPNYDRYHNMEVPEGFESGYYIRTAKLSERKKYINSVAETKYDRAQQL